jgi:hypothetical protein
LVPRDWWLEPWEKRAIIEFHKDHPVEGYRRLAFMMLDSDVVAVSPSSVYRVLRDAGLIKHHNSKPSLKMSRYSLTVPDPERNLVEEQFAIPSPDVFRGRRYGIARFVQFAMMALCLRLRTQERARGSLLYRPWKLEQV